MDKSKDSIHLFDTVILILNRTNEDVEKYIEVSLYEGLKVELFVREDSEKKENSDADIDALVKHKLSECVSCAEGLLVITDDDLAACVLDKKGVAVVGYRAPGYEYKGFFTKYVVEELPMVEDDYFNLVYMRARHIPVVIAQTERTVIREMTENDLMAMYELYADPAVAEWTEPLYEYDEELEFTRAYIENMYVFYGYGMWLVFDRKSGELIGRAGLSNREIDGKSCCELGYIIKGDRQRQGLGYEVGSAVTEYAFHELGMSSLWLCTEKDNVASIALAKKLGFSLWGSSVCNTGRGEEKECYIYKKSPI